MLTLKDLKEMEPGKIFANGLTQYMNTEIKWVAVRGGIHDWAIYFGHTDADLEEIKDNGDKMYERDMIKDLISCDDESFSMYRY